MLKLFILSSTILFLTFGFAQTNSKEVLKSDFPACELVLSRLIQNMDHLPLSGHTLSLAKKKEGYFVVVEKYENRVGNIIEYFPVWLKESQEYVVPDLKAFQGESASEDEISAHFSRTWGNVKHYDFYMYYGYPESAEDILRDLGPKKDPSLYEYEQLARAHSNIAQRYFHPLIGGISPDFSKDFTLSNYEKIPKSRIDQAMVHIEKSTMFWKHIEAVNPNYVPFIITNIHLKTANEYMHFWSMLMSVKETESAQKFLDQVNYSDVDLAVAKRMLDNCEENGFLITNGDNDTYPVWYAQEKLNYRKDVVVLNTSLMQTDWYLTMSKARGNYRTNFTPKDYTAFNAFTVVSYEEGETSIETLIQKTLPALNRKVPEEGYMMVPNNITIKLGDEEVPLEIGTYLFMWQLALLDIVISNPDRQFISPKGNVIWKDVGLDAFVSPHGAMGELVRGNDLVSKAKRESHVYASKQLEAMDLTQINASYLTRFELQSFLSNLTSSRFIHTKEFEKIGMQLIENLNMDDVAQIEEVYVVYEVICLYDLFNPEKAVLLRDAYLKKADEMIASFDNSGANFMEKIHEIDGLYLIYTGKSLYGQYSLDTYEETPKQAELVERLKAKIENIKQGISSQKRIKTESYIDFFQRQFEEG